MNRSVLLQVHIFFLLAFPIQNSCPDYAYMFCLWWLEERGGAVQSKEFDTASAARILKRPTACRRRCWAAEHCWCGLSVSASKTAHRKVDTVRANASHWLDTVLIFLILLLFFFSAFQKKAKKHKKNCLVAADSSVLFRNGDACPYRDPVSSDK